MSQYISCFALAPLPVIGIVSNGVSIFSPTYTAQVLDYIKDKKIGINVISKSGTTTEPTLAFRVFKELLEEKYGKEEAAKRIYATTDRARGTLKELADSEGYETFVIPDDVGGRYSVLTACGLLPIAVAGIDIDKMMQGAQEARETFKAGDVYTNDCYKYAAMRNILYRKGKSVEMMVAYEPDFTMMNEWFKQLFGESEGKENKGIFPASAIFSTDLHSLGQYVQDGERLMFETVVKIKSPKSEMVIKEDAENKDGFNFVAGKTVDLLQFHIDFFAHPHDFFQCFVGIFAPGKQHSQTAVTIHIFFPENTHGGIGFGKDFIQIAERHMIGFAFHHHSFAGGGSVECDIRDGQTEDRTGMKSHFGKILRNQSHHTGIVGTGADFAENHLVTLDKHLNTEDSVTA